MSDQWMIHHDGAPAHTSELVQKFLAKHHVKQIPHGLSRFSSFWYFFYFLGLSAQEHRFTDIKSIDLNTTWELKYRKQSSTKISNSGNSVGQNAERDILWGDWQGTPHTRLRLSFYIKSNFINNFKFLTINTRQSW